MIVKDNGFTMIYDGIQDFCKVLDSWEVTPYYERDYQSTIKDEYSKYDRDFTGADGYRDAKEIIVTGGKYVKDVQRARQKSWQGTSGKKLQTSKAGFMPCMPRYMAGDDRCMYRQTKKPQKKVLTFQSPLGVISSLTFAAQIWKKVDFSFNPLSG